MQILPAPNFNQIPNKGEVFSKKICDLHEHPHVSEELKKKGFGEIHLPINRKKVLHFRGIEEVYYLVPIRRREALEDGMDQVMHF